MIQEPIATVTETDLTVALSPDPSTNSPSQSIKNLLIYAPVLGRGGCSTIATKMARVWSDIGVKVSFLGSKHNENEDDIPWDGRVEQIQLDPGPHPGHPDLFDWIQKNAYRHYEHLNRIAGDFDGIWLPMPWHTMRYPEWTVETPTVAFLPDFAHDYLPNLVSKKYVLSSRKEAFNFSRWCSSIVFSSVFQRNWGREKYGMERTRLIHKPGFIPEGFEVTDTSASEARNFYNLPDRYILAFHVYGHKDPITLLKGYFTAKSVFPDIPPLVIAGYHSESFAPDFKTNDVPARQVQSFIMSSRINWEDYLRFLGFVPTRLMGGLYAGAEYVIAPSQSEGGVSGTICEAAEAETPVIYSDIPAHVEVLGKGNGAPGYTFNVGNAGDLSLAICKAHVHRKEFAKLGKKLKEKLVYNWTDVGRNYLDEFRRTS